MDAACVGDFLLCNGSTWKGEELEGCNSEGELKFAGTAVSRPTHEVVEPSQAFEVGNPESAGVFVRPSACHTKLSVRVPMRFWCESSDVL